ncbi:MAG: class I SAM-dependent methyltransferase [Nocardioidaceae bacterium]
MGHHHGHHVNSGQQSHHHDHDHDDAHDGLPDLLDLDAEVLAEQLDAVLADIDRLVDSPVRSILDLGAGTGTGTFGLLRHFPGAHALAVDSSEEMLERLRRRAELLGLRGRVSTLSADLDHAVPELEPVDLAWASASLHHLADPARTLAQLVAAIRPGGLLAVVELAGFPRFLPDHTPGGAAEARAHALLAADRTVDMPTMGSDWGIRLTRTGLVVERDRPIVVDLAPPSAPVVADYAAATLMRIRGAVADLLDTTDREALDALLNGGTSDIRRRSDLHVTTERRLWIARRPTASTAQPC